MTPISLYRRHSVEAPEQRLAVAEERAVFPLQPVPTIKIVATKPNVLFNHPNFTTCEV